MRLNFFDGDARDALNIFGIDLERKQSIIPKRLWQDYENKFYEGFKLGWDKFKFLEQISPEEANYSKKIEAHYIQNNEIYFAAAFNLEKKDYIKLISEDDYHHFGFALGIFLFTLRRPPEEMLYINKIIKRFLDILKEQPLYYEFFKSKFNEWNTQIRQKLTTLTKTQQITYGDLLENI